MKNFLEGLKSNKWLLMIFLYWIFIVLWWIRVQILEKFDGENYYYDWAYGLIPFAGFFYALYVSNQWGRFSSYIGRALIYIGIGMLMQFIGLQIWTYYNVYLQIEAPYPSVADFGYFLLVPFYTLAAINFARSSGAKYSLATRNGKIITCAISSIIALCSILVLFSFVQIDPENLIKTLFDVAYPIGQIIPFGISMYIFYLSRHLLGGIMKRKVLFFAAGFAMQFVSEYAFIIAVGTETYTNGGFNDLLYPLGYLVMISAVASFDQIEFDING